MAAETLLVRDASFVLTMDPERRILTDGAVAIEGDRIVAVGKTADVAPRYPGARVVDGRDRIVTPGLVDAHVHNTQHLARGFGDEVDLQFWTVERIYRYEQALSDEEAELAALLCQLEMIRSGTTCFVDPGSYVPGPTGRAMERSGLRGWIARASYDVHRAWVELPPGKFRETTDEAVERGEAVVREWHGRAGGRIRAGYALRVLQNCSDDLCRRLAAAARRDRVLLQCHAAVTYDGVRATQRLFGKRDIERLAGLGLLGPNFLVIHCVWVTMEEVLALRDSGTHVAHCPAASAHGAYGALSHGKFPEMAALGVNLALGSDSAPNGNFVDMLRVMTWCASGHKEARADAGVMPAEQVLEMATLGGARAALWADEIGSLEVGKKADLALFRMDTPHLAPVVNPAAALVYAGCGPLADTVICDGRLLMERGRVLTLDEGTIVREAQRAAARLARAAGLEAAIAPKWPVG